jgi:NAD(P)-dependent dehydrogenase (short-subunit alcohol dehydrogenase family)
VSETKSTESVLTHESSRHDGAGSRYLSGEHVVVTGGSRGIGAAIAESLALLGARLTLMARNHDAAHSIAQRLHTTFGAECIAVRCDVADPASVTDAFTEARGRFGDPYVLINNAGQATAATFADTTLEVLSQTLAVNLTGTFLCTQQVLPAMRSAGRGRVINMASTAGLRGYSHMAAYCASKHGVIGLTRALAIETAKAGITVNAVCPGYTDTDMFQTAINNLMTNLGKTEEEAHKMLTRSIPRGTVATPAEVADTVAWLCSPDATAITGQAIAVAGGEVM